MQGTEKYIKRSLNCTVSVFDQSSKECIGIMMDCNDQSVILSSACPLKTDADYEFLLVDIHPEHDDKRLGTIKVHTVKNDRINYSLYGTELEVIELSEEAKKMFNSYEHLH